MSYNFLRSLTVDHTQCGASDSSDFPVLVHISDTTFKTVGHGGHVENSSGFDIGFFSDLGLTTPLFWEVEFYDGVNGILWAWVKIPTLSHSGDTVFYVAYGDATISTFQSVATSVWKADFLNVHHFSDGTTLSVADSTSNANNLTNSGGTASTGQIDGGITFNGTSDAHKANGGQYDLNTYTMEGWVKPTWSSGVPAFNPCVFSLRDVSGSRMSCHIRSDYSNFDAYNNSGSAQAFGGTWAQNTWFHIVFSYNAGSITVYQNGVALSTHSYPNGFAQNGRPLTIGNDGASEGFTGSEDEFHFYNVAVGADWALQSYNNQFAPNSFITVGTETSTGGVITRSASDTITLSDSVLVSFLVPLYVLVGDALVFSDGAPTYITYDPSVVAKPGVTQDLIEVADWRDQTHNPSKLVATQDIVEYGRSVRPILLNTQNVIEIAKDFVPNLLATQTLIEIAHKRKPKTRAKFHWTANN